MDLESIGLLGLYLGITAIGYMVGKRLRNRNSKTNRIGTIQMVVVVLLVFVMGCRIGSSEEVIRNIDTLGLTALIFTIMVMAGSIAAVFAARKILGINRGGVKEDD